MPDEPRSYQAHVDGLRAVAVVAVVLYHLQASLLPGGFVGVDAFFVVSGFVVGLSVAGYQTAGFGETLAEFYARRVVRILPALVVCLVLTTLASSLLVPASWLSSGNEKTGLRAFFGLSNMTLAANGGDYFAPRAEFNPFTHTWSLGVEEQFYLLFPWLFGLWRSGRRAVSATLFGCGLAASVAWAAWLSQASPDRAFYLLASRFWEIAAGVLLMQALAAGQVAAPSSPRSAALRRIGAVASLAALCAGFALSRPQATPFPDSLLPCAGVLGLLACLEGNRTGGVVERLLTLAPARFVGQRSYSLYLWHWPVFVLFRWTVGLESPGTRLAALGVAIGAAALSFRWVEAPPRRLRAVLRPRPRAVLLCGLALVLAGLGLAQGTLAARRLVSLSTVMRHAGDWDGDAPAGAPAPGSCRLGRTSRSFAAGAALSYVRLGCRVPADRARLFVVGDSHASAYLPMLRRFVLDTGREVLVYTMGGCGLLGLPGSGSGPCTDFKRQAIVALDSQVGPGDVVFLPALRIPRIADEFKLFGEAAAQAQALDPGALGSLRQEAAWLAPVLQGWTGRRASVLFEAPTPVFPSPPFRCADVFDRMNPICAGGTDIPRQTIERWRRPVLDAMQALAAGNRRVGLWDPLPVLCPQPTCSPYHDGRPLFFDGDHLSRFGNLFLLASFEAAVAAIGTAPGSAG